MSHRSAIRKAIRGVLAFCVVLLLLWPWPARGTDTPALVEQQLRPQVLVDGDRSSISQAEPESIVRPHRVSAESEMPAATHAQVSAIAHIPGSRHFLPFELPGALDDARRYATSSTFNPSNSSIDSGALQEMIESYNERIRLANEEALRALNAAVTWKLEADPQASMDPLSDLARSHAWVVGRTYADGTKRRTFILPGEYRPLDGSCQRAQAVFLEGEAAIASAFLESHR
jgi:hypothetical protein